MKGGGRTVGLREASVEWTELDLNNPGAALCPPIPIVSDTCMGCGANRSSEGVILDQVGPGLSTLIHGDKGVHPMHLFEGSEKGMFHHGGLILKGRCSREQCSTRSVRGHWVDSDSILERSSGCLS